jgi:hypothetical protein
MDQLGALPSVVAKTLTLVGAVSDTWTAVGNYVESSAACVNILDVTALDCGREMYCDLSSIILWVTKWVFPAVVGLMQGLAMTEAV